MSIGEWFVKCGLPWCYKSRGGRGKGTASQAPSQLNDSSHWFCDHCTYVNVKFANTCQM
uniref:RanBP2-type domain-containing protein n=1 Tax=Nelumbo nucifera TaxID=4432 RepID=A0A822XXB6_NELNU|nr:TPA_asm: hypothetical protein HUJ06_026434 [Nelumbo nucifera]